MPLNRETYKRSVGLKNNKDLGQVKPEKAWGVVLIHNSDYVTEMNEILTNTTTFSLDNKQEGSFLVAKQRKKVAKWEMLFEGSLTKPFH